MLGESVLRTQSEARLSALVEHSRDVILVLGPDTAVEYVSPSIRAVLGYDAADFVGRRFVDDVIEEDQRSSSRRSAGCLRARRGPRRRSSFVFATAMVACCTRSVCSPTC